MPNEKTLEELRNELEGETIQTEDGEHQIEAIDGVAYNYSEDKMLPHDELGDRIALPNTTNYGVKINGEYVKIETLQKELQNGEWEM